MGRPNAGHRTPEQIAEILYESEIYGVSRTARKHDLSRVTFYDWRKKMETEDGAEIKAIFVKLMEDRRANWAERIDKPIHGAIEFISQAVEQMDASNPDAVQAVSNALKVLAEAKFASEVFNVFARKQSAINGAAGREDAADRLIDGRSTTAG